MQLSSGRPFLQNGYKTLFLLCRSFNIIMLIELTSHEVLIHTVRLEIICFGLLVWLVILSV